MFWGIADLDYPGAGSSDLAPAELSSLTRSPSSLAVEISMHPQTTDQSHPIINIVVQSWQIPIQHWLLEHGWAQIDDRIVPDPGMNTFISAQTYCQGDGSFGTVLQSSQILLSCSEKSARRISWSSGIP